jgi:hypothetical protein
VLHLCAVAAARLTPPLYRACYPCIPALSPLHRSPVCPQYTVSGTVMAVAHRLIVSVVVGGMTDGGGSSSSSSSSGGSSSSGDGYSATLLFHYNVRDLALGLAERRGQPASSRSPAGRLRAVGPPVVVTELLAEKGVSFAVSAAFNCRLWLLPGDDEGVCVDGACDDGSLLGAARVMTGHYLGRGMADDVCSARTRARSVSCV